MTLKEHERIVLTKALPFRGAQHDKMKVPQSPRGGCAMTTRVDATLTNGLLKPDQPLPLPDQTRVRLTVEPVDERQASSEAWANFREWVRNNPLHLGGKRYTRDELYDRR